MSFVAERRWALEAKRRRQMYLDRIRDVTKAYAGRNRDRLETLRAQGLDVYVVEDYRNCCASLDRVERLLSRDPERARDENIRLSGMLRSLSGRARENRRAAQASEREAAEADREAERDAARGRLAAERDARADKTRREQAARDEFADMIREARQALPGVIARDLCQSELMALRNEIEISEVSLEDLDQMRLDLKRRLDDITAKACTKMEELRLAEQRDELRREMTAALEDALAVYSGLKDDLAQSAIQELQLALADDRLTTRELDESLAAIREAADDRALLESARRHVVEGLLRELHNAGFIVADPKIEVGEAAAVLIKAQRPSGAQAAFRVMLDGMSYKFDHYQGEACLEDANKVMPRLEDIYGIELDDEKVSWRNPDIIGKSRKRLPDSSGARRK